MIDLGSRNYIDSRLSEFKNYMETDFTFKLIVGMSKVFVTKEEFKNELGALESRLNVKINNLETKLTNKIESLARMVQKDIALPHERRIATLEGRFNSLES